MQALRDVQLALGPTIHVVLAGPDLRGAQEARAPGLPPTWEAWGPGPERASHQTRHILFVVHNNNNNNT